MISVPSFNLPIGWQSGLRVIVSPMIVIWLGVSSYGQNIDWTAKYRVHAEFPRSEYLGELQLIRDGERTAVVFASPRHRFTCVFTPSHTISSNSGIPMTRVMVFSAQATGRVPFMPLILDGVYPFDVLVDTEDGRDLTPSTVYLDAVSSGGNPATLESRIDWNSAYDRRRARTIETLLDNKVLDTWRYSDYVGVGDLQIPKYIERTRHKIPGVDIPTDRRITWTLIEKHVSAQDLSEGAVLSNGASVQDNRLPSKPVKFKFRRDLQSLDELAESAKKDESYQSSPLRVHPWALLLPILLGIWVGWASSRRIALQGPR